MNKEIRRTIKSEANSNNFVLYHNGISIVCDSYEYDSENNTILMEDYSVVNGAQSILTFNEEKENLSRNIKVMVKLTQVNKNPELTHFISHYNNNQNSISMKDLRSKDKIQKKFRK